jgi:hypothetical protein
MKRILFILIFFYSFSSFSQNKVTLTGASTPVAAIGSGPSILFLSGDSLYNRGLVAAFGGTFSIRGDQSMLFTPDTLIVFATQWFVDSLINQTHPGSQTLSLSTPSATGVNLAISGGNSVNFVTATETQAGLLDSARAHTIDSVRNKLWSNGLQAALNVNPNLNANVTINFVSKSLNLAAASTGIFELTGVGQDTTASLGLMMAKKDSSTGKVTWSQAANRLPLKYVHTIFTPSSGGTVTAVNNQENIINPTGTLSTLTIALPSSPLNNDVMYFTATQTLSAITYTGGTVVGHASATASQQWHLTYDIGTTSWY